MQSNMGEEMVVLNVDQLRRRTPNGGTINGATTIMELWKKHSIYKVPPYMKDQNPKAYTPQLVSIGPYHYGQPHLAAMEEHKARALQQFLNRTNKTFDEYCGALRDWVPMLMDSYQQLGNEWRNDPARFLQLMVIDGSFLYEFLRGFSEGWDYGVLDPVFSFKALLNLCPYIVSDILMIENQLPLKVIERLIAVETGQLNVENVEKAHDLVFKFLSCPPLPNLSLGLHVLDVSRKIITKDVQLQSTEERKLAVGSKSATELFDAGVRLRKCGIQDNTGISYHDGILNLPLWRFESSTEPLFLNATSFERLHLTADREVSSYVAFMQGLISSGRDVGILRSQGLIESTIGSDDVVASIMTKISKDVFFDPCSNLCEVRDMLNEDYEKKMKGWRPRFREWRRKLKDNYFGNPWTIISLLAAIILLVLTFLQTVYTIIGNYKTTRKLGYGHRLNYSGGAAILSGMWTFNRSLNSCLDQILALHGTRMQQMLAKIILTKHHDDTKKVRLVSKHFFAEKVFDDSHMDQPLTRWRFRNHFGDIASHKWPEDSANELPNELEPQDSVSVQKFTGPDVTADPLDFGAVWIVKE